MGECPSLGIYAEENGPDSWIVYRFFRRDGVVTRRGMRGRGRSPGTRAALLGLGLFIAASVFVYRQNRIDGAEPPVESVSTSSDSEGERSFYALMAEEGRVRELFEQRLHEMLPSSGYEGQGEALRVELFARAIDSPCGAEGFYRGSFYCVNDGRAYLDLRAMGEARPSPHYQLSRLAGYHALHRMGRLNALFRRHRRAPDRPEPILQLELEAECAAGTLSRSLIEHAVITRRGLLDGLERQVESAAPRLLLPLPQPGDGLSVGERKNLFEKGLDSARIEACERFAREALVSKIRG